MEPAHKEFKKLIEGWVAAQEGFEPPLSSTQIDNLARWMYDHKGAGDIFWDPDNPEVPVSSVEDFAEDAGVGVIVHVQRAIFLSDVWAFQAYNSEEEEYEVLIFNSEHAAQAKHKEMEENDEH